MKLKKFTVEQGGRFDGTTPIVIDFSKSKMVGLVADQELGKSTIEELFLFNIGMIGGAKVVEALTNRDTGLLQTGLQFEGNDKASYEVFNRGGKLTVKRDGETPKGEGGPQELLRRVLGVAGVSPLKVKNGDIDEIVKWLASYSNRPAEEFLKDMTKNKNGQKDAKKARAAANSSAKGLREYLSGEGYVDSKGQLIEKKWTDSEIKFKTPVKIDEISARLEDVGKKKDKYIQNETKVKSQKERKAQVDEQIRILQNELGLLDKAIVIGDKWISDNKNVKKEYETIKEEYDTSAQKVVDYNNWLDVKRKKKELDEFETLSQKADAKEKQLVKEQQELQWEVIPDIKGVEIILEDTHEDEGEQVKAGFYYNGLNSRQLSASEWFGLVMQILKKNKIKIMVIDDISQFGSKFMDTLNKLVESGCYVLYSEMSRTTTELEIQYK